MCVVVVVFRFFFLGGKPYPKRHWHFFDDKVCKLGMFHWKILANFGRSKPWEVEVEGSYAAFFVVEKGVRIF